MIGAATETGTPSVSSPCGPRPDAEGVPQLRRPSSPDRFRDRGPEAIGESAGVGADGESALRRLSTRRIKATTTDLCGRESRRQPVNDLPKGSRSRSGPETEPPLGTASVVPGATLKIHQDGVLQLAAFAVAGTSENDCREILAGSPSVHPTQRPCWGRAARDFELRA